MHAFHKAPLFKSFFTAAKIAVLVAAASSLPSFGAAHCGGTVVDVGIGQGGTVNVALAGTGGVPINSICSVSVQGTYEMDTATCKSAYAALLVARATSSTVGLYYNGSNLTACTDIVAWSAQPSVYFVEY